MPQPPPPQLLLMGAHVGHPPQGSKESGESRSRPVTCSWPNEHTVPVLLGREQGTGNRQPAPIQATPARILQSLAELAAGRQGGQGALATGWGQQQAEEPGEEGVAACLEEAPPRPRSGLHLLAALMVEMVGQPGAP